jgi:hypothetical protein
VSDKHRMEDLFDRLGPDFSHWRDGQLANETRRAVLMSPALRATWDDSKRLDALLRDHERAAHAKIASGGATDRVAARVLTEARPVFSIGARARAVAAALALFAFLGGASMGWLVSHYDEDSIAETYLVEGFVIGGLEGDVEWN